MGDVVVAPAAKAEREALLEVRDLRVCYATSRGTARAVSGVSFGIAPGEVVGVVGESGSGKSVTSLAIMRLIRSPGRIDGGTIDFGGDDLLGLSESQMRKLRGNRISMVFQEPSSSLNPAHRTGDQIAEVLQLHHPEMSWRAARQRTIELFELVGIPAPERRVDDYPHTMSGGMCQRVMIAMALANDPDLLILDEPTTALDVTVQAQILELVRELRERLGTAVLLITHDLGVVAEMADRIVVMYGGRVVEQGTAAQVIQQPRHPYTAALLSAIPSAGANRERLSTIRGTVTDPFDMPPGCPFEPRCAHAMDRCRTLPPRERLADGREVLCWLYVDDDEAAATPAAQEGRS